MARARLSNAIVSDYLRKIGAGEIEPGAPLPPESVLCESYGVGRSVVREALQALDAKGFIVVRQGSVATVAPKYHWHVLDQEFLEVTNAEEYFSLLQEARELLEPRLASIAATRASDEAIDEMFDINQRLASVKDSPEQHAELDIAFHDAVARATDNAILVSMHSSITGLGQRTRSASAAVPGAIDRAVMWHDQIVDALRSRDAIGASAAMHLHLRQVREELARLDKGETDKPGSDA
ncbi:FadR/GntR family transcriptional regulator [Leifsonia sp. H3M29-4]|uniref:FadR/GntR family transcriptional regulator n=1 Tax=Salinibacterium metalliresistens TaxID=3031321 RepID=UPI0023DCC3C8|nr:FadR/GntR family transcriptional regulator [Salinibacterium metalliresistens]MDF1478598.1 FadR/GntR family transcriptional regulator [Salinibacterium metalliresistens]